MQRSLPSALIAGLVLAGIGDSTALESEPVERPGIRRAQFVTDVSAIVPGEPFIVGLLLEPLPGHHTYWRGPGIVGVATQIDWTLPEGFVAGELIWPPPTEVLMAGIVAHGYKSPVLLLTEIAPPAKIEAEEIAVTARASWMSCAVSCNPGFADLSLTLPVAKPGTEPPRDESITKAFANVRAAAPRPAPSSWNFAVRLAAPDRIELDLVIPGLDPAAAARMRFFCDDMQVDSDEPQQVSATDPAKGALRLTLARPEFAPKAPSSLSGVLHCPGGWPGIGSPFVEISVPWPKGTFPE